MRIIVMTDDDVRTAQIEIKKDGWESRLNRKKCWDILSLEILRCIHIQGHVDADSHWTDTDIINGFELGPE